MPGLLRRRRQLVLGGSGLDAASLVGDVYFPLAADALAVKGGYTPTSTRSTTAAFTDYEGVVRMAAVNELRFEGGRRVENLCLQSEAFGTSPWTQTNVSTDANSITGPDGTITADTQTASADNGTRVQTFTIASSPFVLSIYLKRKTGTGAISLSLDGGSTYTVVAVTSEWQRFHIVQTLANPSIVLKIAVSGDAVYAWGAQLERTTGSTYQLPSEYVPTTTAAASKWFATKPDGSPIYPVPKLLMEGQSQNKVTCKTANPTDLTGVSLVEGGDANAILSVVDDSSALAAAGLNAICSSGKVYKLDNSLGSIVTYATIAGVTENTNPHTLSCYGKRSGTVGTNNLINGKTPFTGVPFGSSYARYSVAGVANVASHIRIRAGAGEVVYFILPQLEESSVLTSVIPNDTRSSLTRTADSLSWPLSAELQAMLADAGTLVLDWTSGCIPPASQIGIVSCNAAVDSLLSVAASGSVTRSMDGTAAITGGATLVSDTQRRLVLRWGGGKYKLSSIASGVVTHGTEGNFDGAFTLGANLLLHYSNAYPARYSGLKIFRRKLTDAELARL